MKGRFVLRVGQDGEKAIEAWGTMWVDEEWFKMATDKHIAKTIKELYKASKKQK